MLDREEQVDGRGRRYFRLTAVHHWPRVAGPQLWEWIGQPRFSLLFLAGAAFAALSLMLATLPHRPELLRARRAAE